MDDIIDLECRLEYQGNIHPNFQKMLYPELRSKVEWVLEAEKSKNNNTNSPNTLSLNDMMSKMSTGME